jgi:mRNA interferase MazF
MVTPAQGEIWWAESRQRKRRPVLIVTRSHALPVLNAILVAPVTRSVRHISTEIPLDEQTRLREFSAASFDDLQRISRTDLTEKVGALTHPRRQICRALAALADC